VTAGTAEKDGTAILWNPVDKREKIDKIVLLMKCTGIGK